jgi:hypothetical protein
MVTSTENQAENWQRYIKVSDLYLLAHRALLEKELDELWQEVPEFREITKLAAQKLRKNN